jgi:LPXTG-site transpeptidase (sortase) family protein
MTTPKSHRRPGARRRSTFLLAGALAFLSLGCLGWVGWSIADARLVEARQGAQLERLEIPDQILTDSSVPWTWPELSEGDLVGRIEIERLEIDAIVLAGVGNRTLRRAVGHIPGTALPGEGGNVGLAGHRDTFFRELQGIDRGDIIGVSTPQGTVRYQVDSVFVVEPRDVHVLDAPTDGEMITLVSCYPFYYVGPAPQRFIVQARRIMDVR